MLPLFANTFLFHFANLLGDLAWKHQHCITLRLPFPLFSHDVHNPLLRSIYLHLSFLFTIFPYKNNLEGPTGKWSIIMSFGLLQPLATYNYFILSEPGLLYSRSTSPQILPHSLSLSSILEWLGLGEKSMNICMYLCTICIKGKAFPGFDGNKVEDDDHDYYYNVVLDQHYKQNKIIR